MLLLVIGVFLLLCTLLFVGAVYLEFSKAEFPPGIACRTQLRRLHGLLTVFSVLGSTLGKLGILSEVGVFRLFGNLYPIRSVDDPELFIKILKFEGVPVRVFQPRDPSAGGRKGVMFFHGGGFIYGDCDIYDRLCRHISKKVGAVVVSVGYRLAPEHKYPAGFEDCLNATIHFLKTAQDYGVNPSSVVICGDSAGGNLTAGVSQALVTRKGIPKPLAQGNTFEKLGVWSEDGLIGFLIKLNPLKPVDDPELFKKNLKFEGVPVRVYQPKESSAGGRKGVMFFHGGGFKLGDIELYDKLCGHISKKAGVVVVSVGYRLAPQHLYPAAFEDCLNATIHFLKTAQDYGVNPSSVVICGDSAGGNLTAGVSQALVTRKGIPKPLAQVLIYPVVQMVDFNLPSYQQNRCTPLLLIDKMLFYSLNYLGEGSNSTLHKKVQHGSHVPPDLRKKFSKWLSADNIPDEFKVTGYKPHTMSDFDKNVYEKVKQIFEPSCSPLVAEDSVFRLLPKAYILTCEFDVLRDEGILYKKRLEDNGVPVTWHHIKDGFHGIISFRDEWDCESGKRAVDSFVGFIRDA